MKSTWDLVFLVLSMRMMVTNDHDNGPVEDDDHDYDYDDNEGVDLWRKIWELN